MKGFAGGGGRGGGAGGSICRKFRDFAAVSRVPDSEQNCVPASSPATSTTAKRSTIMKTWISAYMYKYVVSIHAVFDTD